MVFLQGMSTILSISISEDMGLLAVSALVIVLLAGHATLVNKLPSYCCYMPFLVSHVTSVESLTP